MVVNIVMLVKDRVRLSQQAIQSLYRNTPLDSFNLTVIDDGSERPVRASPDAASMNAACLRIENSKQITGQARNLGIYWAEKYWGRGDFLYLTDNDVYFTPGWLLMLASMLRNTEGGLQVKVLGGWNHPYLKPNDHTYFQYSKHGAVMTHDAVTGASQLMRWETWDKYGPLDAHAQGVGQSEDWAFCQKIIQDGGRVGSIYPRVVFNCGLTNSFGQPSPGADVMLKELQEAKVKYPDLYWE